MDPTQIESPQIEIELIPESGRRACPVSAEASSTEIGRGRSGVVYLGVDEEGRKLACKIFDSQTVTKAVQIVSLGSPNPYVWNEDAVRCAMLRRRILVDLVDYWFTGKLAVAAATGYAWNVEHRAFELFTDYSPGRPIPLHHPFRTHGEGLLKELTSEVMRPLQEHLIESGFDGLVWQAGKGNPVALNNFLREGEGDDVRWVWIDLESGVPALIPANPWSLFSFYLPRSIGLGRPLFDDVDVPRLLKYITKHHDALAERLGEHRMPRLRDNAQALRDHQAAWKNLPLHCRSIGYQLARGRITQKQGDYYRRARVLWFGREAVRFAWSGLKSLLTLPKKLLPLVAGIHWSGVPRFFGRMATSHRFRGFIARRFVASRIRAWCKRGQLSSDAARGLRDRLANDESSEYLADFGVHIAIKPFVKLIEFWILPMMWGLGLLSTGALAVWMLACGPVMRTFYTGMRGMDALREGKETPWVALAVGAIPVLGNLAYPMQILYSSTEKDIARFILYDAGARVGRLLPIWGGKDTWTEHFFNRLPDLFTNLRRKKTPNSTPGPDAASV
jgi:hypothetical protein